MFGGAGGFDDKLDGIKSVVLGGGDAVTKNCRAMPNTKITRICPVAASDYFVSVWAGTGCQMYPSTENFLAAIAICLLSRLWFNQVLSFEQRSISIFASSSSFLSWWLSRRIGCVDVVDRDWYCAGTTAFNFLVSVPISIVSFWFKFVLWKICKVQTGRLVNAVKKKIEFGSVSF